MPRCGTLHLFLSLLAAAPLLASASRKVDEECISDIQESLIDLADSPKAQLRQAFQTIARSQLYGRPLQIQEHLEKRVYDILSAVDQCGAGTPAVPCLLDSTLPPPPRDKKIFIASNLHNTAALMPHYITQLLLSVVSLVSGNVFVSVYESGSTDATGEHFRPLSASEAVIAGTNARKFWFDNIYSIRPGACILVDASCLQLFIGVQSLRSPGLM